MSTIGSLRWQVLGLVLALGLSAGLHWDNDGLWFQGDAPRHAANGFFFWDLATAWPSEPLQYALSYYARYPVITPGSYPPLFYLVEGAALAVVPSPHVLKALVLVGGGIAGLYAMCWGRRWIGPAAGWAGVCVLLLPGVVRYSNAVLLNVPALALGLASLYHLRRWFDAPVPRERWRFTLLIIAVLLTYYPGGIVMPVALVWTLMSPQRTRARRVWMMAAAAAVAVIITALALPTYFDRQAPELFRFLNGNYWMFYLDGITRLTGLPWLIAGAAGLTVALRSEQLRGESARFGVAVLVIVGCLVMLPARDERYALLAGVFVVLSAFAGAHAAAALVPRRVLVLAPATIAGVLLAGLASVQAAVPRVTGVDDAARFFSGVGSGESILYSGVHDGVFGFYVRAADPKFERRVVLASKLLFRHQQDRAFNWIETPFVSSTDDVVTAIRERCGCRWVAVESGPGAWITSSEQLLRRALDGPDFERVRSFEAAGRGLTRIDLYRVLGEVQPAPPLDLVFPSFSSRVFPAVEPIASRR